MRSRIAIFAWYELSSFILRWHSRGQQSVATLAARSSFDIGFPCSHNKSSDMTIGKSIYRYIITVKPACLSNIVRKNGILGRFGLHHRQSWIPGFRRRASRGWRHDRPACLPHRSIPSTRRGRLEQRPITMHRTLFRVTDRVALSGMESTRLRQKTLTSAAMRLLDDAPSGGVLFLPAFQNSPRSGAGKRHGAGPCRNPGKSAPRSRREEG